MTTMLSDALLASLLDFEAVQLSSPIGPLTGLLTEQAVIGLRLPASWQQAPKSATVRCLTAYERALEPLVLQLESALNAYFSQGSDAALQAIPLLSKPLTPFQREVAQQLQGIPLGQTLTYGQLAQAVGRPKASRSVGTACATNAFPLLVPCHRVLRQNGQLGGFLGGQGEEGLALKRWLLQHEKAL